MPPRERESPARAGGGLPDGLVLAVIAVLLGVTVLVWTATGVAGLFSHGGWPAHLHFTRTPRAMRSLAGHPHDMAAAWPQVPAGRLPGPGLFWWVLSAQLALLVAVAVWALRVAARLRAPARRGSVPKAPPYGGPEGLDVAARTAPTEGLTEDPAGLPAPRRAAHRAAGGDESLDAWFRTVPRTAPPGGAPAADPPTMRLAPHSPDGLLSGPQSAPAGHAPSAARPALAAFAADGAVVRGCVLFAEPGGDKGRRVVQPAVLAAEGAVVVTTADPDTYHQTAGGRAKLGPVHVWDPAHVLDLPGRLRWAPHDGCERPGTALTRAAALLAPLRTARADETAVHQAAVTLLRCWLHAAAVDGRPFRQVQRWATGGVAGEAVRVLRTHRSAASGWSGELESVLHAHPERRDAAQALIRRALEPLAAVHIRDACGPGSSGGLDLASFTAERGTLYVVGERVEDPRVHPGATPLLTALVSCVVEHGRSMAAGSPAGRLDPPVTFVLDDVAALAPLPELPELLAEGRTRGLPALAVLRSPEQALARWQSPLWQRADVRLVLDDATADALPPAVPDAVRLY
ncbi:type IV secretory system conjugative DNA transfer family protein [Actinacidiphila yeochonensis]|uniref:type IV secretory system conjugative DNA transfer family protein n=1 Tax=Actinacidiphila yeochonensis TaxID=89050 RepID=UPI0006913507|nr:TraM recognition domain-containing protein [Actinacidiphila yeochonensis]